MISPPVTRVMSFNQNRVLNMAEEWSADRKKGYGIAMKRARAKMAAERHNRDVDKLRRDVEDLRRYRAKGREKWDRAILIIGLAVAVLVAKIFDLLVYGLR